MMSIHIKLTSCSQPFSSPFMLSYPLGAIYLAAWALRS
jgi:hypothetical protein